MNGLEIPKAKDLIKSLYINKAISCKEVSNIYHNNIDFITKIAINSNTRIFYIAIDRIYLKKLFEFNLLNNKSDKSKTHKSKSEDNQINNKLFNSMEAEEDV